MKHSVLRDVTAFSEEEIQAIALERLREQLNHCGNNSQFYADLFDKSGLDPDKLTSIDEFRSIKFHTSKEDERANEEASMRESGHPFGSHLCVPPSSVSGISASSGTSGQPTFSYLFTDRDLEVNNEVWRRALRWMGIERGELVLHTFGLSMWVLGCITVEALGKNGMRVLPVGAEAGAARALQIAARTKPRLLLATPSMAERMLERSVDVTGLAATELGIDTVLCVGEPGGGLPEVRRRLSEGFGGARVFDGMIGSAGVCQLSCPDGEYRGMHQLTPDLVHWDLVDPQSYEAVDGRQGRGLVTSLLQEARPFVKFDMGDLIEITRDPCQCGSSLPRFRIYGRADDMLIVGGVNVYASAIKDVVSGFSGQTSGELRIHLDTLETRVRPPVRIAVEVAPGGQIGDQALTKRIEQELKERLRFSATIELVPYEHFDRSTGKTRLIQHSEGN